LFEWVLRRAIMHHLEPLFTHVRPPRVRYRKLKPVSESCAVLLSALAYVGHSEVNEARRALAAGAERLPGASVRLLPIEQCSLMELNKALDKLGELAMPRKRDVLSACAACISADHEVTVQEGELLRAVSDALDCPMPPLLPGQRIA